MTTLNRTAIAVLLVPAAFSLLAQRGGPPPQPAGPPKNLKILPQDVNIQQTMGTIRASLGVQCNFCHNPLDFSSDENPRKSIARNMMRMMHDLNTGPLDGKMQLTCYTCHRGEARPKTEPPPPKESKGRGREGRGQ